MRLPVSPLVIGLNRGLPAPAIAVAGFSQKNYGGSPLTPAIKTSCLHLGSGMTNDLMFPWIYLKVHILFLFSCQILHKCLTDQSISIFCFKKTFLISLFLCGLKVGSSFCNLFHTAANHLLEYNQSSDPSHDGVINIGFTICSLTIIISDKIYEVTVFKNGAILRAGLWSKPKCVTQAAHSSWLFIGECLQTQGARKQTPVQYWAKRTDQNLRVQRQLEFLRQGTEEKR